jgi:cephalosporin hydroxylase
MEEAFERQKRELIRRLAVDRNLYERSTQWITDVSAYKYPYFFTWLGRPIIQFPQDIVALQEIIWSVRPDAVIETGIAHGGSLVFYASILELIGGNGRVLGIDIDIREHNRIEIEKHPMSKRITMVSGSSVDEEVVKRVINFARDRQRILVVLDSMHTHEHVLKELRCYSPLVKKDSYLIVLDTIIEDMPEGSFPDRPWDRGNNPKTAVWEFLKTCDRFTIDKEIENKLLITVAPDGYLKCVKD